MNQCGGTLKVGQVLPCPARRDGPRCPLRCSAPGISHAIRDWDVSWDVRDAWDTGGCDKLWSLGARHNGSPILCCVSKPYSLRE